MQETKLSCAKKIKIVSCCRNDRNHIYEDTVALRLHNIDLYNPGQKPNSKLQSCFFCFVFKSESPATIAVFYIQAFVYPIQFLQNLSFPDLAGAGT